MEVKQFRPLGDLEMRVMKKLISAISPNSEFLKRQIDSSLVREVDEFGSLEFLVSDQSKYSDVTGPFITAQQEDIDTVPGHGPYINFSLLFRDGIISEFEVYKDDGGQIKSSWNPDKFVLTSGLPPKT